MKPYRTSSSTNRGLAALITPLLIAIVGCDQDITSPGGHERFSEVIEQNFPIDDAAAIRVDNFVGKVTFRTGDSGTVWVRCIKRAAYRPDLDRIDVMMNAHPNALVVRTEAPENLKKVSVDLEITAPPGAQPQLATGVGDIDYVGRPRGLCRLTSGVGSITLRLHPEVSVTVELDTGVGSIVLGFPVEGSVRLGSVKGRIGSGSEGDVHASTRVGNIYVTRR